MSDPSGTDARRIIWLRPDSIGDNILAASMLPYLRERFATAQIIVVCQEHVAELYEAWPHVDAIAAFNRRRALSDAKYLGALIACLRALDADLLLSSVYSREPLTDLLALGCEARQTVALDGDLCNMTAEMREANNRLYSQIIPSPGARRGELERHRDFLTGLGFAPLDLAPMVWITPQDVAWAEAFLSDHQLDPEKTIVLFAGAQHAVRLYERYGEALERVCREEGFSVVALGVEGDGAISRRSLKHAGARSVDLCGRTTIRQSAALLGRCRLGVGAETGLAHLACAMDTPNVVLLGGGHFGRFMPYSTLTTVACLPLACYDCNWRCRYSRSHCVTDLEPAVLEQAIRVALAGATSSCQVIMQTETPWTASAGLPPWQDFREELAFWRVAPRSSSSPNQRAADRRRRVRVLLPNMLLHPRISVQ